MATLIESSLNHLSIPQSPKKRKHEGDTQHKSKKKRKQGESLNETTSQLVRLPVSAESAEVGKSIRKEKKDKKDKKEKKSKKRHVLETGDASVAISEQNLVADQPEVSGTNVESDVEEIEVQRIDMEDGQTKLSDEPGCFHSRRISLQVPIPAISQATAMGSLLSLHLCPLLLTYFPPLDGIVISFSDPVLSARPQSGVNLPLQPPTTGAIPALPTHDVLTRCADEFGVSWVWVTATFLVFQPEIGSKIGGWTNVQSEGFVGLVSYNYFQAAIGKTRIPRTWRWNGSTPEQEKRKRTPRKGRLRDVDTEMLDFDAVGSSQVTLTNYEIDEMGDDLGCFVDASGQAINQNQSYTVVDMEMVPGQDTDHFTLQIEGTLLLKQEESEVVAEEQRRYMAQERGRSASKTPGPEENDTVMMSGGLGLI